MPKPDRVLSHRPLSHGALPRFLALYGALFLAFGIASPFLAAFLAEKGLSPEAVGLALSAGTAARILAGPAGGRAADRLRAPRTILTVCAATAASAAGLYLSVEGTLSLVLVSMAHAAALASLVPMADTLTLASAIADRFAYGWVRGAGSTAYILGTLISGQVVALRGLGSIIWLSAGLLAVTAWCATRVPDRLVNHQCHAADRGGVLTLLRISVYRRLMVAAAMIQGSHAMHDGFAVINWSQAGISIAMAGMLWSLSVTAEVVVFLFLGRPLIDRLTPAWACVLAALAGVVRWGILAASASVWAGVLAEPLHGFSYALQHLVCMRLIGAVVPAHLAATAQAFYNTVAVSAVYAFLMLASGWLYAQFGAHGFLVMAGLCAAAVPIASGLRSRP